MLDVKQLVLKENKGKVKQVTEESPLIAEVRKSQASLKCCVS